MFFLDCQELQICLVMFWVNHPGSLFSVSHWRRPRFQCQLAVPCLDVHQLDTLHMGQSINPYPAWIVIISSGIVFWLDQSHSAPKNTELSVVSLSLLPLYLQCIRFIPDLILLCDDSALAICKLWLDCDGAMAAFHMLVPWDEKIGW